MLWRQCNESVEALSPKAAQLAARMLHKDPLVPQNWAFAMNLALAARARGAEPLSESDLVAVAEGRRGTLHATRQTLTADQQQAWDLTRSIRSVATKHILWDPRTPLPEESRLLAFSEEMRSLAGSRFSREEIAHTALNKLDTDGHRDPLLVVRAMLR
ncbi:hypothetical protein [Variovorax sp. KK3]